MEQEYLSLVANVLDRGISDPDERTGTGVKKLFGATMRCDLSTGEIPLLTTRKLSWKNIVGELLWIMRGETNASTLSEHGIHIWDANASESSKMWGTPGDLGPIYGFQWRHAGAIYRGSQYDYTGQGIDQLRNLTHTIRTNPSSRRAIINSWNCQDLQKMALPPCHVMYQCAVHDGKLHASLYQRSGDMALGVPYNMASYALLTNLIAHCCDLQPGTFMHVLGDYHIYNNHIEHMQQLVSRKPFAPPTLCIKNKHREPDMYEFHDIALTNYKSHPSITGMKMAL